MYLTEKEKRDVAVRKARNGRGIFARRDFRPEDVIFQVVGKRIECNEDDDLDEKTRNNTYRFDADTFISPAGRLGDFLNHSCEPSAKVIKKNNRLFIVTARPIAKGEEVAIDYSTITASDDVWEMQCNCGTKSCRGTIQRFRSLPRATRKDYLSRGLVPDHVLGIG